MALLTGRRAHICEEGMCLESLWRVDIAYPLFQPGLHGTAPSYWLSGHTLAACPHFEAFLGSVASTVHLSRIQPLFTFSHPHYLGLLASASSPQTV